MSKDSEQPTKPATENDMGALRAKMQGSLQLGHLGTLNQVTKALGKVIRAMADGSYDSQAGARICNGLGIMRACLETATLERIEDRLAQLEGPPSYGSTQRNNQTIRTH